MSPLVTILAATLILGPPVQRPTTAPRPAPAEPTPPTLPPDDGPAPPTLPPDDGPAPPTLPPDDGGPTAPPSVPTEPEPALEPGPSEVQPPIAAERPDVALPPDFPASVDPYDETTWAELTLEQKDRLRALRASAVARAAEAAGPDDPAAMRDRAYARELREVRDARRDNERDDVQLARRRAQVIRWARPRLIGFGVSLGGGLLLSILAVPLAARGRPGGSLALGTIGGLGIAIGLPGVIATALVRSAHLRLDGRVARTRSNGTATF